MMMTNEMQNKLKHKEEVKRKITFISNVTLITAGISDVVGLFLKDSIVMDLIIYASIWSWIYLVLGAGKINRLINFMDDEDVDTILCLYSVIEYSIGRIATGVVANSKFVSR